MNKLQPTSLTPNPKLFEQNRAVQKAKVRASESRKEGYNFAGLQTYIISEIDSGSDNKGKAAG